MWESQFLPVAAQLFFLLEIITPRIQFSPLLSVGLTQKEWRAAKLNNN